MNTARGEHTAVLLPSGKVLVAGGSDGTPGDLSGLREAELYDPDTGHWTPYQHTATLLPSGKVLIAGGRNEGGALATYVSVL